MKETSKSLKIYFLFFGLLGATVSLLQVFAGIAFFSNIYTVPALFVSLLYYVLAFFFIYFGIEMYRFLRDSPKTLIYFLASVLAINTVYSLLAGELFSISFAIAIVIVCYLIYNINKISKEERNLEEKISKQSTKKQILVIIGILIILLLVGTLGISTLFISQKDHFQEIVKELEEAKEKGELEEALRKLSE
jgi:hypothetical protein